MSVRGIAVVVLGVVAVGAASIWLQPDDDPAAPPPTAGPGRPVDVTAYFLVDEGRTWPMARVDKPHKRKTLAVERGEDGAMALVIPREDGGLWLTFEVAGDALRLLGVRLVREELQLEGVRFDPPAAIGDAGTLVDGAPLVTPTAATAALHLEVGPIEQDLDVALTGDVSASWRAHPPLGGWSDVLEFELRIDLVASAELGGMPVTREVEATVACLLARDVGFVQLVTGDDTWQLVEEP